MVIILKKLKMEFEKLKIDGLVLCKPKIIEDDRGFFAETFRKDLLEEFISEKLDFCQHNTSKSSFGVLRGLHFQTKPKAQTKLVSVSNGEILDVVLDIRKDSPTFGQHFGVELNATNRKMVYIPKGCAHGFITLLPDTEVLYLASSEYMPSHEMGIRWDDPLFSIQWPLTPTVISDKDQKLANYTEIQ